MKKKGTQRCRGYRAVCPRDIGMNAWTRVHTTLLRVQATLNQNLCMKEIHLGNEGSVQSIESMVNWLYSRWKWIHDVGYGTKWGSIVRARSVMFDFMRAWCELTWSAPGEFSPPPPLLWVHCFFAAALWGKVHSALIESWVRVILANPRRVECFVSMKWGMLKSGRHSRPATNAHPGQQILL